MARTWEDGSYKFPFMDMKAYNAVCHADDLVMGGVQLMKRPARQRQYMELTKKVSKHS